MTAQGKCEGAVKHFCKILLPWNNSVVYCLYFTAQLQDHSDSVLYWEHGPSFEVFAREQTHEQISSDFLGRFW